MKTLKRWKVEGADQTTGADRSVEIEAETREEAERRAGYNGLLVSAVAEILPGVNLGYAGPSTPKRRPEPPVPATKRKPDYGSGREEILRASRWMSILWQVVGAIAAISFIVCALCVIGLVLTIITGSGVPEIYADLKIAIISTGAFGFWCFLISVSIRLARGIGLFLIQTRSSD